MILDTFPSADEFYRTYWGKKPFIIRNYIDDALFDNFIDGDTLAGLSLEEDIRSRIITNNPEGNDWTCEHGPFNDDRFENIGDENWSLLVQNVEQYHTDTAKLLKHFQLSPRWLLDDIMVSFSAPGGSVGPHTDSYHTFLVQGIGRRTWKISQEKVQDDRYADNPDMKILEHGFDGETFEVTTGDIIYMPPFFGHEGKTLEPAMTFSVGFLGPKLSEMLGEYAQFLEENDEINHRFLGEELSEESGGFTIGSNTQNEIRDNINASISSDAFSQWLTSYFSTPTHNDVEDIDVQEEPLSQAELEAALKNGATLHRPEETKLTITPSNNNGFHLSAYGDTIFIPQSQSALIKLLNDNIDIDKTTFENFEKTENALDLITALYNKNVLSIRTA